MMTRSAKIVAQSSEFPDAARIVTIDFGQRQAGRPDDEAVIRKEMDASGRRRFVLAGVSAETLGEFQIREILKAGHEIFIIANVCDDVCPCTDYGWRQLMAQSGVAPVTFLRFILELHQGWARGETHSGVVEILEAMTSCGMFLRVSEWKPSIAAVQGSTVNAHPPL